MIPRTIDIEKNLEKNKVLIIYGPRQVGKTTSVKKFLSETSFKYASYSGDDLEFSYSFSRCSLESTKRIVGENRLIFIDEAQKIENIGTALKLIVDNFQDIYVIATGSSSFDLANTAEETLTGRKNLLVLYPISIGELLLQQTLYEFEEKLEEYLIYGTYPEIITHEDQAQKEKRIIEIKDSALIKDLLVFQRVKRSRLVIDLANTAEETLTGRKNLLVLYPISIGELLLQQTLYEFEEKLEEYLIYGTYPEIITHEDQAQKEKRIIEIKDSALIKDLLVFQRVKRSRLVIDLLKLLAFQVGSEVSCNELGERLGLNEKTVRRYLDLLEKSFVLFRLDGFSRNLRKEVSKMSKYYFYDLGIRNALISNFNDLGTRNDVGQLWENFMVLERIKRNAYRGISANYYFWRTYDQKEIDLIEERGGMLYGYEFKWRDNKKKPPKDWLKTYSNATYDVVTPNQYLDFVT